MPDFLLRSTSIVALCSFYLGCQHNVSLPEYTEEEKAWLDQNPVLTLSVDETYPPLNFKDDNGELVGVNIDLVRLIEKQMGIRIVLEGSTWDLALERAMYHEVDGVINATALDERRPRLNFTIEFFEDPQTMVCSKSYNHNGTFEDFENAKIAVKKNSFHHVLIKERFSPSNVVEVETVQEGIRLLNTGIVDAVYDDFAPVYHIITSNNLNNISIAFVENQMTGASIGLRNDDPMLLRVFNKAMANVDKTKIGAVKARWLDLSQEFDYTPFYVAFGILGLLIISGVGWNYSLRALVARKTSQLNEELIAKERVQAELTSYKDQLEELIQERTAELKVANDDLQTINAKVTKQNKKLNKANADLKLTQERLIQSEKLASLGVFTAGIAHEINNPINYITSGTDILFDIIDYLKDNPEGLDDKVDEITTVRDAIKIGVNKTVMIISSLRNYAHSDEENFVQYDVIRSIEDALLLLNNTLKYRIKVEKSLPQSLEIDCLPGKINQIFVNLINNAAQSIEHEGVIKIICESKKKYVDFKIEDDGSGIEEQNLSNIFDPFFTTKSAGEGTGLGLYIVHGIVKQHGGEIKVKSTLGEGTIIHVRLPKAQPVN